MGGDIYTIIRGVYSRLMAPRPSGNETYGVWITAREAAMVQAERRRRGVRYLSTVVDEALRDLLVGADPGTRPLPVPPTGGEPLVAKCYQLRPATIALLQETARRHGFQARQIVRAAIHEMERRARSGQGPTQTGR